jgi:hypothetical protein
VTHPFNATNAPGTCRWCGRKLRQKFRTEYDLVAPKRCWYHVDTIEGSQCKSTFFTKSKSGRWNCEHGHWNTSRRVVKSREKVGKLGDYGDGHFCGLSCGYNFGRALADEGRVLVKKAKVTG